MKPKYTDLILNSRIEESEDDIFKDDIFDDWIFLLVSIDKNKRIQTAGVLFGGFVMAEEKGGIGKALELVGTFNMNKAGKSFRKGVERIITNEEVLKIRSKKFKKDN